MQHSCGIIDPWLTSCYHSLSLTFPLILLSTFISDLLTCLLRLLWNYTNMFTWKKYWVGFVVIHILHAFMSCFKYLYVLHTIPRGSRLKNIACSTLDLLAPGIIKQSSIPRKWYTSNFVSHFSDKDELHRMRKEIWNHNIV